MHGNMSTGDVKSRYGEPYTAFWLELVPKLLEDVIMLTGPVLGEPNIDGIRFTQEFVDAHIAKNVIIGLSVLACTFAVVTTIFVISFCRNKRTPVNPASSITM